MPKQNSLIKIAANHFMKEVKTDILVDPFICIKLMRSIAYSLWIEFVPTYVLSSMLKNAVSI